MSKKTLDSLNLLRAICMFMVFFCHLSSIPVFKTFGFKYSLFGAIAVSIFFIISGVCMTYNYPTSTLSFKGNLYAYWNRLSKVYPTAFIVAIICIPLAYVGGFRNILNPLSVVLNFTLTQAWVSTYNITGVLWFLSVLLFCYLCFPYLNIFLNKIGFVKSFLFILVFYLIQYVFSYEQNNNELLQFVKTFPPYRIYEFMIGMFIGKFIIDKPISSSHKKLLFIALTPILLATIYLFLNTQITHKYPWSYTYHSPIMAFIIILSLRSKLLNKLGQNKIVLFLSGISFSFYLFHQSIIRYYHAFLHVIKQDNSLVLGIGGG